MKVSHISLMDLSSGDVVVTNNSGFRAVIDYFLRDSVKSQIDDKSKSIFTWAI